MGDEPQDLKRRTKQYALRIIRMYSELPKHDVVAQVLGKQVLRSGTSVGANYREAAHDPMTAHIRLRLPILHALTGTYIQSRLTIAS